MKSRRGIAGMAALLLLAAGGAAALYWSNRRPVTTSSSSAFEAYRDAIQNERRFYFKEARVEFARALELDPEFAEALLGLARLAERDQALSLVERARRVRERLNDRERLHVDLQYALWQGKFDELTRIARTIYEKYPDDVIAAKILAGDENIKGRTDRAVKIFSDLLAIDPNNAEAYNQIGYYYGYRGNYEKAIENLKKYQFMAPDQANPYDSLGEIQAYSGHYEEAIANLHRALSIKPGFYQAYDHLGVAHEGKGDYPKAIESFEKAADGALSDGERSGFLTKALGVALFARDRAAADQIYPRFAKLPKDERTDLFRLFVGTMRDLLEDRPADAERRLLELRPRLQNLLLKYVKTPGYKPYEGGWNRLMAVAKIALGREAEAIPLFEEMANPPNPWRVFQDRLSVYEGRACLAALLAKRGDLDRAEKLLAENHKWNPSWAPTRDAEQTVAEIRRQKVLAAAK